MILYVPESGSETYEQGESWSESRSCYWSQSLSRGLGVIRRESLVGRRADSTCRETISAKMAREFMDQFESQRKISGRVNL